MNISGDTLSFMKTFSELPCGTLHLIYVSVWHCHLVYLKVAFSVTLQAGKKLYRQMCCFLSCTVTSSASLFEEVHLTSVVPCINL